MTRSGRGGPFLVPVGALRTHPGTRRAITAAGPIPELAVSQSQVPEGSDVVLEVVLESFLGGITVTGTVSFSWEGRCRRCLEAATGTVTASLREVCSDDPDLEVDYPVTGDWLDLEPVAHDACILELPLAPLCRPDCLGLCPQCGANRNDQSCTCTTEPDPRWAALARLGAAEVTKRSEDPRAGERRAGERQPEERADPEGVSPPGPGAKAEPE